MSAAFLTELRMLVLELDLVLHQHCLVLMISMLPGILKAILRRTDLNLLFNPAVLGVAVLELQELPLLVALSLPKWNSPELALAPLPLIWQFPHLHPYQLHLIVSSLSPIGDLIQLAQLSRGT
jgi:hypothetical protein